MAKKKELKTEQIYYIQQKGKEGVPASEISEVLGIDLEIVNEHMPTVTKEPTRMQKLMGTKERNGVPVAAIMTKEASGLSDDLRQPSVAGRKVNCIHRCKEE